MGVSKAGIEQILRRLVIKEVGVGQRLPWLSPFGRPIRFGGENGDVRRSVTRR